MLRGAAGQFFWAKYGLRFIPRERKRKKQMKHRGRKSAAELSVIAANPTPTKRDPPSMPPDHLQEKTKEWWKSIAAHFQLEPHQYRILQSACEAWDLYQHARAELNKYGLTFTDDKGMVRARPEAAIARDARTSFLRALRELKLDVDPPLSDAERIMKNNARGGRLAPWMRDKEDNDDAS
jgi:P27 family predicted phage terminase small subunit